MKQVVMLFSIIVCGAGMVMGQTEWVDDPGNPLFGPGDVGPWDIGGPWARAAVFDGTTYHLYITGSASNGSPNDMGHATSPDGESWTMDPANPVLTRGGPGEWDSNRLDGATVVHDGMLFHMWYSGWGTGGYERVGYATSPDGTFWTKYHGNPVMDVGPPGSWDDDSIRPTTVMIDDGEFRMWFGGAHCSAIECTYAVGYAESYDGITWTKLADPVLSPSTDPAAWDPGAVSNPYVVFDASIYHMWYSGGVESSSLIDFGIGYAWSGDGINWTKHRGNPIVTSEEAIFWHSPVLLIGSTWHMWVTSGVLGSTSQVDHATSDCCSAVSIFADGFENGDTFAWSAVVP